MENINIDNLKSAVYGFLNSVTQTGSDLGSNIGTQFSHFGDSISDKLPTQLSQVLPLRRAEPPPPKLSGFNALSNWICEHKTAITLTLFGGIAVSFAGYYYYGGAPFLANGRPYHPYGHNGNQCRRSRTQHRRLAQRAENGGRREVVLLVGSPKEPLVRLIAQDLNIRGFIVYITSTPNEEDALARENSSNEDIRFLKLDSYFDPAAVRQAISHLNQILETPVRAFSGAEPHLLALTGIIIIPDLFYPTGPLEMTTSPQWSQTLQSKLQMPLNFLSLGGVDLARKHSSRFLLLTPVIMGALSPAFYTSEALVYGALSSLSLSLARELEPQGIPFTHVRLGSFDTRPLRIRSPSPPKTPGSFGAPHSSSTSSSTSSARCKAGNVHANILSWPEDIRRLYGSRYRASAASLGSTNGNKGSNLRDLYHAIYDTLTAPHPSRVVRVGQGSRVYDWISTWLPERALTMLLATNKQANSS